MNYLSKSIFPILALATVVSFSSCKKDFLDVNTDPNRVTDDNITPELLFPQAADATGRRTASTQFSFVENWMGYLSTSGDFAIDQTETSYAIDFGFGDGLWQNHYGVLFDLYLTKRKAEAKGDSVLAGASMILSAKLWQELVDIYGNIPFSQAFQNSVTRTPGYDAATAVYAGIQKKLDTAITYMGKTTRSTFATVDIVNHGDKTLWVKFANTLKLRLLIRQSQVAGFDPTAEIAKINANGAGFLESGQSITVNPGYANETAKQSPFYANYGFTPTGADASTVSRANAYFVNLLTGTADSRLTRFFAPVGTSVVGTTYGLAAGNPKGANSSKFGPGLIGSATQNQWIFTSVESMFLVAEATARGWLPGDAQAAYEAAVTESFIWLGVPDAETEAADYMANTAIADWTTVAAEPVETQAKFIAYQKYIALAGIDPLESWSDLRRLNMIPDNGYISVNPSRVSNTLPVRLLYPQSEYTTNSANVNAQGTINAFTSKLFWQP